MKVAVIIAHTASGWKLLSVGDDISALKQSFKDMKIAGQHAIGEEAADVLGQLGRASDWRKQVAQFEQQVTALREQFTRSEGWSRSRVLHSSAAARIRWRNRSIS